MNFEKVNLELPNTVRSASSGRKKSQELERSASDQPIAGPENDVVITNSPISDWHETNHELRVFTQQRGRIRLSAA